MSRLKRPFLGKRRSLRNFLVAIAATLLMGYLSNELSVTHCLQETRDLTEDTSRDMLRRVGRHGANLPQGRHIIWLSRANLYDEAPGLLGTKSWWYPPLLVPRFESGVSYPWAYAVPLRWPTPFVVRVAYGFAIDGQSGGTGMDYYATFFGGAVRIHRRTLSMF